MNPITDETKRCINLIQRVWHIKFDDEFVPGDRLCKTLLAEYGLELISYAIEVCSVNQNVNSKSFEDRIRYTRGILKNIQRKRWEGDGKE